MNQPHDTHQDGGESVRLCVCAGCREAREFGWGWTHDEMARNWAWRVWSTAPDNIHKDAEREYQQRRPFQEDGHLAADEWWRLHPEGVA